MTRFRELVAVVVAACLIPVGFPPQAQAMAAAELSEGFRQKVEQLGVGAELRVGLKDGQALRGTVESFDESGFRLRPKLTRGRTTVPYADLTYLELTKNTYRAKGSPGPVTARRVAVELGVGRNVLLQTQDGKKAGGRIAKLDEAQLSLDMGGSGPMNVSYAQIHILKPKGKSPWVTVGVVGGIVGVLLAVAVAKGHD